MEMQERERRSGEGLTAVGPTEIWRKYEAGVEQHRKKNLYRRDERCWHFYNGDQWYGMPQGKEELPSENFIKPILKYKIALVATTDTAIVYSSMQDDEQLQQVCKELNRFGGLCWEHAGMDAAKWQVVKAAAITGDSYLYTWDDRPESEAVAQDRTPRVEVRVLDRSAVYLADEQEPDLQKQGWIIVAERRQVGELRKLARENGVSEEMIETIAPDDETETLVNQTTADEVDAGEGKCTSLVFFRLRDDEDGGGRVLEFGRSTRTCVWQPVRPVPGMDLYPIAQMRWEDMPGTARGVGECEQLIPNQIEANKTLARRSLIVKRYGYPTAVYDRDKIANPAALKKVGSAIEAHNLGGVPVNQVVQYLEPRTTSGEGAALQQELITTTRELEGASDSATGQIDVTKTSGEAIKAARDQSALTVNDQSASYKSFVEQMARIWYKIWCAYSTLGLAFAYQDEQGRGGIVQVDIPPQALRDLDVEIKVDVSPADPYSILSQQQSLDNALAGGHISFEEWVEALDDNSPVPAAKFRQILQRRQEMAMQQMQAQIQAQQAMAALQGGATGAAMPAAPGGQMPAAVM